MLKNGINFFVRRRFAFDNILKRFILRNEKNYASKYSTQLKLCCDSHRNFNQPPFRNMHFSYKQPVILLSGILSFLDFRKKQPEEPELILKMKMGILAMERKQFEKAERELHSALNIAQNERDEEAITFIFDLLANLAFETESYEKARALFVSVLQRLLAKGEEQNSNKVIHISLKLARIFQETNETKLAEEGYKFCLETLEKKLRDEDNDTDTLALWGMSMDWYGKYLLAAGKNNEAFEFLKKAYDTCVKVNGMEHEQTAVLLNDLGTISSLLGDDETALSYFEKAKDIGSKLPKMEYLSAIYVNLGKLYLFKEMYNESKKACEEGLKKAKHLKDGASLSEAEECLKSIKEVMQKSKEVAA